MKKALFLSVLSLYCFKIQCRNGEGDRTFCAETVGIFSQEAALKEFAEPTMAGEKIWFSCRPEKEDWKYPVAKVKQ